MRYDMQLNYGPVATNTVHVSAEELVSYLAAALKLKSWDELVITRQWEDENE